MTRKILGGLAVAALLLSPAAAFATRNYTLPQQPDPPMAAQSMRIRWDPTSAQRSGSLGSGILWGQSLGTVSSPSNTQVDPSFRGPLNDVQPGAQGSGSSDPPQAANPKPVY